MASPGPVFIRVKYGENDTLICNPGCATVNLLTSIKRRTGHGANTINIDLTDDSGLVQELDLHRQDCAADHLSTRMTYVLVKKQRQRILNGHIANGDALSTTTSDQAALDEDENEVDELGELNSDGVKSHQYDYIPLLNNWRQLLPGYRVRRPAAAADGLGAPADSTHSSLGMSVAARRKLMRRDRNTSASPAGVKPTVGGKVAASSTTKMAGKERSTTSMKVQKVHSVQTA